MADEIRDSSTTRDMSFDTTLSNNDTIVITSAREVRHRKSITFKFYTTTYTIYIHKTSISFLSN